MTVGAPLVGALRGRIVPRLSRRCHVAIPGARKDAGPSRRLKDAAPDADPSRRLESRRSTPRSDSAQAMAGGRWRRSGEGDHKGRPYESFDSGNTVVAADGQSPPRFSRDHAGCPAVGGLLRKTWGTRRGDILVPLFAAVAFAGLRWGRSWSDRRGDFQSPRGSGGRKTPTPFHAGFRRTGAGGGAPNRPVFVADLSHRSSAVRKPPLPSAGPGPVGELPK